MKFLCDEMLGTLSKWLRIFGFDAADVKDMEDKEIMHTAKKEKRIIITRDKNLAKKSEQSLYIEETELEGQINAVVKFFQLNVDEKGVLSRCTVCNVPVIGIKKTEIENELPEFVRKIHDEFWKCPQCLRVYWMGSHWENIRQKIQNLKEKNML